MLNQTKLITFIQYATLQRLLIFLRRIFDLQKDEKPQYGPSKRQHHNISTQLLNPDIYRSYNRFPFAERRNFSLFRFAQKSPELFCIRDRLSLIRKKVGQIESVLRSFPISSRCGVHVKILDRSSGLGKKGFCVEKCLICGARGKFFRRKLICGCATCGFFFSFDPSSLYFYTTCI